jgi:hypothetical protein
MLREQLLEAIEQRHAAERAYQAALAEWQAATAAPEQHAQWMQFYANALRGMLHKANSRRKEVLTKMIQDDWRAAVYREMQAECWYEGPESGGEQPTSFIQVGALPVSRNGNGAAPKVSAAVE